MDGDLVWGIVSLTAIMMIFGRGIVHSALQTFERIHMAKLQFRGQGTSLPDEAVAQLRDEIALLRDTTTRHAISLQHSVERLEHRVEFLEQKSSMSTPTATSGPAGPPPPPSQPTLPRESMIQPVDPVVRQQIAGRL